MEQELEKSIQNSIIIRPALVYGPGDRTSISKFFETVPNSKYRMVSLQIVFLAPRLVVGGIYKYMKEMMKLPWNEDIKAHTVHVTDLVRATYFLCQHGKHGEVMRGNGVSALYEKA